MKRRKPNSKIERHIITGMIVSDRFLREIKSILSYDYFQSDFAKHVSRWCIEYFNKYEKAPNKDIQEIFEQKTNQPSFDPDLKDLIAEFLDSISEEYSRQEKFNSEYVFDQAEKYFKERFLRNTCRDIQVHLSNGNLDEAETTYKNTKPPERPQSQGIEPLGNQEFFEQAFEEREKPLFQYPGDLGMLINWDLHRGSFIAFLGPEKRGKTFWLTDVMFRALRENCNVAMFQCGDMTERQFAMRMSSYLTKSAVQKRFSGEQLIPVLDCQWNQEDSCNKKIRTCDFGIVQNGTKLTYQEVEDDYVPCDVCRKRKPEAYKASHWLEKREVPLLESWKDAYHESIKWQKIIRGKRLKLSVHPTRYLSSSQMVTILDYWEEEENFIPDVIVIDYIDIMASANDRMDYRHQVNEKWISMRQLSQERHCLIVTATQSDSSSYNKTNLDMSNFSENKLINAHVTSMYALNQTKEEKREKVMRIGQIVAREDDLDIDRQVKVLQGLAFGRPYLASYFV